MLLVFDQGNSCLKWGVWENFAFTRVGVVPHQQLHDSADLAALTQLDIRACAAVSVTDETRRDQLSSWCKQHLQRELTFFHSQAKAGGVVNAYAQPAQLGADRWAALIAARARTKSAACVIDCGTAVTVDVMNAQGQHLGGLIVPGVELMRRALRIAPGIGEQRDQSAPEATWANNTAAGISLGAYQALQAFIRQQWQAARDQMGAGSRCFITGGDAASFLPGLNNAEHAPYLVLEGVVLLTEATQD